MPTLTYIGRENPSSAAACTPLWLPDLVLTPEAIYRAFIQWYTLQDPAVEKHTIPITVVRIR